MDFQSYGNKCTEDTVALNHEKFCIDGKFTLLIIIIIIIVIIIMMIIIIIILVFPSNQKHCHGNTHGRKLRKPIHVKI